MKFNIFLMVIDSLQARKFYGKKTSLTPNIDSLIKKGIKDKLINDDAILESLIAFKRAGASAIVTYFALEIASKIK